MDFTKAEADVCQRRRFAGRCYPCEGNPQEGIFLNACICVLRHILHFSLDINTACVVRLVCSSAVAHVFTFFGFIVSSSAHAMCPASWPSKVLIWVLENCTIWEVQSSGVHSPLLHVNAPVAPGCAHPLYLNQECQGLWQASLCMIPRALRLILPVRLGCSRCNIGPV